MTVELRVKNHDSKTEVVAAYEEILQKLKDPKKETAIAEPIIDEERKRVIDIIAKKAPEDFAKQFDSLKQSILYAIDDLKDKFLQEQAKLTEVVDAIELKNRELDELHGIEANVNSLAALLSAQKEKTISFEKDMNEKRQQFGLHMEQQRRDWQQEEQKFIYQRDLFREKEAARYKTEYLALEQEIEARRHQFEQELAVQHRQFQNEMQDRETRVIVGERELQAMQELKDKVAQIPSLVQEAARKAEENITKQLTLKFDYEAQLLNKEIRLREQTIQTLEIKVELLQSKIVHFETLKNSLNRLAFNMSDNNAVAEKE